jgi:predicted N-acetyltransferase YhbS
MGDGVRIRPFRADDVDEVLEVLRAALGESPILKRTPELWAWKHVHNPFGRSLVLLAETEGQIAGVRALMRWDLRMPEGGLLHCLRPVDTATHPKFERRGIFRQLTETAIEQARQDGYDLIFNTPNAQSGAGYLTMGWQPVGPIGVMLRPLLRAGVSPSHDLAPDPLYFFEPPAERFRVVPGSDREGTGLRTPRTPEYLEWRFLSHPYVPYRSFFVDGSVAVVRPNLRNGRKEVVISDLLNNPTARLVRHVARGSRARYLAGWFSQRSPERKAAVGGGMWPVPRVRSLTLVAQPLRPLPIDVFKLESWDIALSDLELL